MHHLLSILIWLPIVGAIPVGLLSKPHQENASRQCALWISLISLVLCVPLYGLFNVQQPGMQFVEHISWIPSLGVDYALGVDGIAMPLVILTCFTTLIVVLASWTMVKDRVAQYLATFLVMQGTVIGVFAAMDAMLFYFFWEAMLIPMYLSIGIWGMEQRSYAAIKFFIYTFLGSVMMLVVILYLRLHSGTFMITDYYQLHFALPIQIAIFAGFFLAFAIKVPMWPFHTWLPDAHTEAPTGGSVVLAALMLKIGGYGFLRFSLPIVPDACRVLATTMIILSLIAIVYIGMIAIAQTDMKKLIAYSSVAHMGFATLGFFLIYKIVAHTGNLQDAALGFEGALVQMVSHSFGAGAMFLAFGVLYHQMHTRYIKDFGGIAKSMPHFAAFFMVFAMSNVGLPGTSGFVGEFMVLLSAFQADFWVTLVAATTLIVGAAYTLWMYKRVFFGPVVHPSIERLKDVHGVDTGIFVLLTLAVVLLGIFPNMLLRVFHASVGELLTLSLQSRL